MARKQNEPQPPRKRANPHLALFEAVKQDDAVALQAALAKPHDLTKKNSVGRTAFQVAVSRNCSDKVLELLIAAGADVRQALFRELGRMEFGTVDVLLDAVNLTCPNQSENEKSAHGTGGLDLEMDAQKADVDAYELWNVACNITKADAARSVFSAVLKLDCIDRESLNHSIATLEPPYVDRDVIKMLEVEKGFGWVSDYWQTYYEQENSAILEDIESVGPDEFIEAIGSLYFQNQGLALYALANPDPRVFDIAFGQDWQGIADRLLYNDSELPWLLQGVAQHCSEGYNVTVLLKRGTNVEGPQDAEETPLQIAARHNNNYVILEALIEGGANLDAANAAGKTPLMLAAEFNANPDIVRALIDAGANRLARDNEGHTAADLAKRNASLANADELISLLAPRPQPGADERQTNPIVQIPDAPLREEVRDILYLNRPERLEDMRTLRRLSSKRPGILDLEGLQYATSMEDLELTKGAIQDISALAGLTSLKRLDLSRNKIANMEPLANLVALTHLTLSNNSVADLTPLASLASLTHLDLANNYITNLEPIANLTKLVQLNLNGNSISDLTPLANLKKLGHLELADNRITDISPLTNLRGLQIIDLRNNAIIDETPLATHQFMFAHGLNRAAFNPATAPSQTKPARLLALAKKGDDDLANYREALGDGADINSCDHSNITVLIWAAQKCTNPDVIRFLVDQGANIDAADDNGNTALIVAAGYNDNPEITAALLAGKPDTEKRESLFGATALMFACAFRTKNATGVLNTLVAAGADLEARNDKGRTPLLFAAQHTDNPNVMTTLIAAGADINATDSAGLTAVQIARTECLVDNTEVISALRAASAKAP